LVRFEGTKLDTSKYFAATDALVLPSIFEGFGIVIIEAFRASLPVIATNIEGPNELINDSENGLLFSPGDFTGLADQITKLFSSPLLRSEIGKSGNISYVNK
ncbi:MAG: glycosyltransferase, partial [Flammeovirgaceae bacterium]